MKIGLLTIHHANSFGGVLQAYASKTVLQRYGDAFVIDYKSHHIANALKLVRFGDGPRSFLRATKDVARLLPRKRLIAKFDAFCREYLDVGSRSVAEKVQEGVDVAVAGSDQIWNPAVTDGLDSKYFLAGIRAKRKISFSSSFGSHRYTQSECEQVRALLADYAHVAVREKDAATFLATLLGREVAQTVDPTLLLDKQAWEKIAAPSTKVQFPFLLVYSLKEDPLLISAVRVVAKKMRLPVVAISQNPFCGYPVDIHFKDAGPSEYLRLFLDASFVVTNSFHGTAFSCNFAKPFLTVKPEHGINRVATLLEHAGLVNRLALNVAEVPAILEREIDWIQANIGLSRHVANSLHYLNIALERPKA